MIQNETVVFEIWARLPVMILGIVAVTIGGSGLEDQTSRITSEPES